MKRASIIKSKFQVVEPPANISNNFDRFLEKVRQNQLLNSIMRVGHFSHGTHMSLPIRYLEGKIDVVKTHPFLRHLSG